jgi:hypothetical protein
MHPLTLTAEKTEDLDLTAPRAAEPMWLAGIEFGGLARTEDDVVFAEHQPQTAG